MLWIKFYPRKWLSGTTRYEMNDYERAKWIDLLSTVARDGKYGECCFVSYKHLSDQIYSTEEETERLIELFSSKNKVSCSNEKSGIRIKILNWEKYQPTLSKAEAIDFDLQRYKFAGISKDDIDRWAEVYPALNIPQQLKYMEEWVRSNPKRIKSNWRRFITNWLKKEQDRARVPPKEIDDWEDE